MSNIYAKPVENGSSSYKITDEEQEAIKRAIKMANKNDIIVLAGKGHEPYQEINHEKHHYDEREIIKQIIEDMENA